VGHPKRPAIIDAKITEEYVICGVCLTKNRIVSHTKVLRPVCGRCGYPLPDPFGVQSRTQLFHEWIAQHRPALAAIAGLLAIGLLVWLARGREERSSLLSGPPTHQPGATPVDYQGAPIYAVAFVVHREASTDIDDERDDLPPRSLPSRTEWQADGLYDSGSPTVGTGVKSESVVIVIDVCAGRALAHFPASGGHDGEWPGVLVSSYLQPMKGDPSNLPVSPHVVERIYINTGLDPRG